MGKAFADRWGVPVRAGSADAVALLDQAVEDLAALAGDPVADAEAAVAADDGLVLGHIYRAYLALYGMTPEGVATAAEIVKKLDAAVLGEREAHHLRAARSWADGDWDATARSLERALLCHPRDLLALKVAQDLYFFLGNRLELRDVAARVLPAWPDSRPGWGYVQGMYAFGLEENADYRQAESRARAALDHNPGDVWSVHALAHVFEMEGSQRDGVEFLTTSAGDWSGSFFAIHNWWHRTLYHLELGETGEALALYDSPIRARRSTEWLDVVDAAALLWRLSLFGVDVTDRAAQLAADIDDLVGDPVYIFNDWHAVMAFALAGDRARVERVTLASRHLTAPTNRMAAERAGLDLLEAFGAFAAGRPDRAIDLLIDIRPRANAVGGSHAQRDVIDLTLIAAAARADDDSLARALVAERVARKPSAETSARQLVAENGGSLDALSWLPCGMGESSASDADRVWLSATWPFVRGQLPPPPARVIELGCGPAGGHVPALIRAGYDATGIDPEAPEGPAYVRTPFETYRPDGPADAVVASASLHHVEDPGEALDHVVEVLRPDGVLVVAEWILEDLDEAAARWCFRHQLRDQAEPGAWLAGMYAGWAASGLAWDAFFLAWLDEHGLHPAAAIRRELDARFTVTHLSTGPYYFPDLADAGADAEQAAIDTGQIKAGCLRYAGRVRSAPDRAAPRYEASVIGRVESPLTDRAQAPRQGDEGAPPAWLVMEPHLAEGISDLRAGDQIIVLTWLDRARRDVLSTRPRDDPARAPAGVFSTRSPDRPNPIGLHRVEILAVQGLRILVSNLEALDATPVLDIKPVLDAISER